MPGDPMPAAVLRAARPILDAAANRRICYISAASMQGDHLELNHQQWAGTGEIHHLDVEATSPVEADAAMRSAALIYITGGNTFVLAYRLRRSGIWPVLGDHLAAGRPHLGISAGAVICGRSILLSNDMNVPGLTEFTGLDLLPFALNVHDPDDAEARGERDERIRGYQSFHPGPALALSDEGELRTVDGAVHLVEGRARRFPGGGAEPVAVSLGPIPS
jgi:peptidase E